MQSWMFFLKEPHVDRALLGMLTIATPHIAGYSTDGKAMGTQMSVQALSRYFNLGLDEWEARNIPKAENRDIIVDGSDGEALDLISEVHAKTYSIQEDHDRFIDDMAGFEKLRGKYRIRREPSAYNVRVFNDDGNYRKILEGLGFSLQNN